MQSRPHFSRIVLGSRLTEARRRLRQRLARRGVDLSAVIGGSAIVAGSANAGATAALVATITTTALQMASGRSLTTAQVSARILALVQGVPKTMLLTNKTIGTLLLIVVGALGSGVAAVAFQQPAPGVVESRPSAVEPRKSGGRTAPVRVAREDDELWTKQPDIDLDGWRPASVAFAPDGKTLAVGGTYGKVAAFDSATRKEKWIAGVGGRLIGVAYSADAQSILATQQDGVIFLDALTGKTGAALEEKGCNPSVVGVFPDQDVLVSGSRKLIRHKVIFGNAERYVVKDWLNSGARKDGGHRR